MDMSDPILQVEGLSVEARTAEGTFDITRKIDFSIQKGGILGIVGESGCGKSVTALAVAGLLPANARVRAGTIRFNGQNLYALPEEKLRRLQGKEFSMIFQEPMTSLNPLMRIGRQVGENLRLHTDLSRQAIHERTLEVLGQVGLPNPAQVERAYPHELSGGMRQRVMIAMAIICRPKLIIADEPTTALDVTVQAQILELLRKINREFGCAILFISHDLSVVRRLCDRTAVMYAGSIVEAGETQDVFHNPAHGYTQGLLDAIPTRVSRGKRLKSIPGTVPDLKDRQGGCLFAPRCKQASEACFNIHPQPVVLSGGHVAYCPLAMERGKVYAAE